MVGGEGDWRGICLFGDVRLESANGPVPSRSAFARTMLALLAVRPGEVVRTSTLIDELWGEHLPAEPKGALQVQATRLRKWLAAAGDGAPALAFENDGYRLGVDPERVDLTRFLGLAASAVATGLDAREAVRRADAAVACATGELFTGCAMALRLESERVRAEELLLQVVERRAEAVLELGDANSVIADLAPVVAQHRAREGLTALLMVALYRAGRQREALHAYDDARRHLVEEYGLEPGEDLVSLQGRVLQHDPTLLRAPEVPKPSGTTRSRPLIVERNDVLAVLRPRGGDPGRIVVLRGEAGIGKTTVLAAAAHDAAADGVLVGWGRWDDSGAPLAAWDEAIDDLGLTNPSIGRERSVAGRAIRALLAGAALEAPVLVVLDDAHLADSMSLGILRALARLGVPSGVTVAVAAREPDTVVRPAWAAALAEIALVPAVEQRQLSPLSRTGVADVVAAALRDTDDAERDRLTELLWAHTAGHPLHVGSLVDGLSALPDEVARRAAAEAVPDRLRPFLAHQLDSLGPVARELLDVLAVLGSASVDVLARLGPGIDALGAARELRPAIAQGMVRDEEGLLAFRHGLTQAVAREAIPQAWATQLHQARYQELVAAGGDPFDVLRHAFGARDVLTPATVASARLTAGRTAYSRGAHEEAAALLEAALPEVAGDDETACRLAHGLNLAALGRREEADALLGAIAADPSLPLDIRTQAAVGHEPLGLSVAGDAARLERLHQVLPDADRLDRDARLELLKAAVVEESLTDGDPTPGLQSRLDSLAADLERDCAIGPSARTHLRLLGARADVEAPIPAAQRLLGAEAALDAAIESNDPVLRLQAIEFLLSASLAAGELERVEDLRWLLQREATKVGRPRSIWAASIVESAMLVAAGNLDDGDALAASALERGVELGIPDAFGGYGVHLVVRHLLLGSLHELAPLIGQATDTYPRIAAWPAAMAVAAIHEGDEQAAASALTEFARRRSAHATRYFDRAALCLAARASEALGDREVARIVVDALPVDDNAVVVVGVGAGILGPANLYVAVAEAVLGEVDAARTHVAAAEALASRLDWRPWTAAAHEAAAAIGA